MSAQVKSRYSFFAAWHALPYLFLLLVLLPYGYIESFDGELRPVVSRLTIDTIEPWDDGNSTRISGTAQRYRGDCEWRGTTWWLGARARGVPVELRFLDPPQIRNEGTQTWTGIIVGLAPELVVSNSTAEATYNCFPKWPWPYDRAVTTTTFYEGRGQDFTKLPTVSQDYLLQQQRSLEREVGELQKQIKED